MNEGSTLALTLHVIGFTFWVGGLFTVALLLAAAGNEATTRQKIGTIARRIAITADVGAALAIVGGVSLLAMRTWDLREPWMHIKLTFVVGLLAVHGVIRVRAKKLANGGPTPTANAAIAVLTLAVAIIAVILFKPMAR